MPLPSLLGLCLLACLTCTAAAGAADSSPPPPPAPRIWSGVVLATNGTHPGQAPERLRKYAGKLKNIFGYNQYELIGESSAKMDDPNERWLAPSKDFSLSVQNHSEAGARHPPTKITLFQGKRRLAEFETHLNSGSPLFIRGPFYAGGQLVIVVHGGAEGVEAAPARGEARPALVAHPVVPPNAALLRERERTVLPGGALAPVPREGLYPLPGERLGPVLPERFGPTPGRFGPMGPMGPMGPIPGGVRRGELDGKLPRP
jgi:hypothetical protein